MRKRHVFWSTCLVMLLGLLVTAPMTSAAIFELTSPVSQTYVEGTNFQLFTGSGSPGNYASAPGNVTAPVQFTGYGLQASEFSGFIAGNIALIERGSELGWPGTAYFSDKVNLAESYGAVGVIVFDNVIEPLGNVLPTLYNETDIPSIFTTYTTGYNLWAYLYNAGEPVFAHIYTSGPISTPEPATMLLLGLGLVGLAGIRRK